MRILQRVSIETRRKVAQATQQLNGDTTELFGALPDLALANSDLNREMQAAKAAFKKTRRAGLTSLPPEDRAEDYAFGADVIDSLYRMLNEFLDTLGPAIEAHGGVDRLFASDRQKFTATYAAIYGDQV